MQEFCSMATMPLHLDIASMEELSSHVDMILYPTLPSHHQSGADEMQPL